MNYINFDHAYRDDPFLVIYFIYSKRLTFYTLIFVKSYYLNIYEFIILPYPWTKSDMN